MRSVSIGNETTTTSTVENLFLFCFYIISTVLQFFYGKNSSKKTIESSKQAQNAKKIESVKKRIVCSNLKILNTYITPKNMKKIGGREKFVY